MKIYQYEPNGRRGILPDQLTTDFDSSHTMNARQTKLKTCKFTRENLIWQNSTQNNSRKQLKRIDISILAAWSEY